MIPALVDIAKQWTRVGSALSWLLAIGVGLLLSSWRRTRSWTRAYFAAVFVVFWLLATPAVSEGLAALVSGGYVALQRPEQARNANTIVVLGGGAITYHVAGIALNEPAVGTAFRVVEAARLYALLDHPTVILMGGVAGKRDQKAQPESEAMAAAIVRLGVPPDRIVLESESKTTREQALALKRMFTGMESRPFVLVTSPTHMPRSMEACQALGLNPIGSPAALRSDGNHIAWLPDDWGLMVADTVAYDSAAWLYYWSRGWLTR